jgi:serine/threonine protein kinase
VTEPQIPQTLGRYTIKGVLGKGAMGLVYDGVDPKLNRRVAIKTILTTKLSVEQARMASVRFEREVRAVARLSHPNIVQVYDFGKDGDLAFIVMEYVQGKELKDFLDSSERLDLGRVHRIMSELLGALDMAHQAGIIHRDVKPANLMITAGGSAKLADFGVARVTEGEGDQSEATRAGTIVGTPSYMSPEQIQGQKLDGRTDVFSAGIIFYQLLTWKKPFEGGTWELQKKIIEDDPIWPSTIMELAPEYDRVIAKALAKDPEQRYQTAGKFAAALARLAKGEAPEEPGEAVVQPGANSPKAMAAAAAAAANTEVDKEFWEGVKDSDDPDEIELYLEQFPNGVFAAEAKKKIAALKK